MRARIALIAPLLGSLLVPLGSSPADAATPIRFVFVQYDSPGDDGGSNASLNAEYVRVKNHGQRTRTLTDWTIRDPEGHVFTFPTFRLRSGRTVTIHTGSGTDGAAHLYWGEEFYVWNNSGDKAILKNADRARIDTCQWDDGDGSQAC